MAAFKESHTVTIDESERQIIMMSLAKLLVERPGWEYVIGLLATKFQGVSMLLEFHQMYRGIPVASAALCETVHPIALEPKESYIARHPKAAHVWAMKNMGGQTVEKRLCTRCGLRAQKSGWTLKAALLVPEAEAYK